MANHTVQHVIDHLPARLLQVMRYLPVDGSARNIADMGINVTTAQKMVGKGIAELRDGEFSLTEYGRRLRRAFGPLTISLDDRARRNRSRMLCIGRSDGTSVAITPKYGFQPYGPGASEGKRQAVQAAVAVVRAYGQLFTGDIALHTEGGCCAPVQCGNWVLVGTDIANVGGMSLDADGAYVIHGGYILGCGDYLEPHLSGPVLPTDRF